MKKCKRKIILLLFILLGNYAFSQNSLFSSDNSKWAQQSGYWTPQMGGNVNYHIFPSAWILKGDTTVNNKLYQKINNAGYQSMIDTGCFTFSKFICNDSNRIYAGIRLDTMLLEYDFNLVKGDSFPIKGCVIINQQPVAKTYYPKVDSISTIFYVGKWRKKIRFAVLPYNTRVTWLEGVGDASYGILVNYFSLMLFNSYGTSECRFNCFYDGGSNNMSGVCAYKNCFVTRVEDNNLLVNYTGLVYPNPVNNILNIKDEQHDLENAELEIWNYSGQLVLQQSYSYTIDVSTLCPGLYTLQIIGKNKQRYYSKFVKE